MSDHLNPARLQLFHRLHEQVDIAKGCAIELYLKEADRLKLDWNNRTWHYGVIDQVDYNGIIVAWEEYHRNCRTNGGQFCISWEALADDTQKDFIADLVAKQVAKQNAAAVEKSVQELAYKRAQLEKLKAELGEA
jgi:hypothetical protein